MQHKVIKKVAKPKKEHSVQVLSGDGRKLKRKIIIRPTPTSSYPQNPQGHRGFCSSLGFSINWKIPCQYNQMNNVNST